jgi:hypothetical protein
MGQCIKYLPLSALFRVIHTNQDNQVEDPSKSFQVLWGHQQDDADYSTTTISLRLKSIDVGGRTLEVTQIFDLSPPQSLIP